MALPLLVRTQCLFLDGVVIPHIPQPRSNTLHTVILRDGILLPMRQQLAGSNAARFLTASLILMAMGLLWPRVDGSSTARTLTVPGMLEFTQGAIAAAILYAAACVSQLLLCGVSEATSPAAYFVARRMETNPVRLWLFNAFAQIKTTPRDHRRLELQDNYVRKCLEKTSTFDHDPELFRWHQDVEAGGFNEQQLTDSVGSLSWSVTILQGILMTFGAMATIFGWILLNRVPAG